MSGFTSMSIGFQTGIGTGYHGEMYGFTATQGSQSNVS
jgi:hypothetical protein